MNHLHKDRTTKDRPWHKYPIGTKAYSYIGGYWERTESGWKWHVGDTFPAPGGDAIGVCIELPDKESPQYQGDDQ